MSNERIGNPDTGLHDNDELQQQPWGMEIDAADAAGPNGKPDTGIHDNSELDGFGGGEVVDDTDEDEPTVEDEPQPHRGVDDVASKVRQELIESGTMVAAQFTNQTTNVFAENETSRREATGEMQKSKSRGVFVDSLTQKTVRDVIKDKTRVADSVDEAILGSMTKRAEREAKKVEKRNERMRGEHAKPEEVTKLDYTRVVQAEAERIKMAAQGDKTVLRDGVETLGKNEMVEKEMRATAEHYILNEIQKRPKGESLDDARKRLEQDLRERASEWRTQIAGQTDGKVYIDEAGFLDWVMKAAELEWSDAEGKDAAEAAGSKELQEFIQENLHLAVGQNVQLGEGENRIDTQTGKMSAIAEKILGVKGLPAVNGKPALVMALAGPGGKRLAARLAAGTVAGAVLGFPVGAAVAAGVGAVTAAYGGKKRGERLSEKRMMQGELMNGEVAEGIGYDFEGKKKASMSELTGRLKEYLAEGALETAEQKAAALADLKRVTALRYLYENERRMIFEVSEGGVFGEERNELWRQMGALEKELRGDEEAGQYHAKLLASLNEKDDKGKTYLDSLKEEIGTKAVDAKVESMRKKAGNRGAAISALTSALTMAAGATVGHAASEAVQNFLENDQGVIGNMWRSLTANGSGQSQEGIASTISERLSGAHEAKISPEADGSYAILGTGEDGSDYSLTDTRVHFAADNRMWANDVEALRNEGFTVSEVPDEAHSNYVMSGEKTVVDYLAEGHENVEQLSGRTWGEEVATTDWHVGEGDDIGYYVMRVADAPEGAEYAISLNDDMQSSVVTYPVENGLVRIPMDDPVASTFEATGRGDGVKFGAAYGEVMTVGENGAATVYHTDIGDGVTTLQTFDKVPSYHYILERDGQISVISSPEAVSHATAATESLATTEGLPQTEVINASTHARGQVVVNTNVDVDPSGEAGVAEQYHFGNSTYVEGASEAEMASNTFSQMLANDAQKDLIAEALGMEPGASKEAVAAELMRQFDGAELDVTDLSVTPNTMTTYQYDGHVLPQYIDGKTNGGHALEARKGGRWLLDSVRLRDFFGIPHDAAGHFAVRLDCGGQIVWIPDATTPEIIPDVTETVTPPTPTPTPTPEPPAPEPEPVPEQPTPEPTPEPEQPTPEPEEPTPEPEEPTPEPEEPTPEPEEPEEPAPKGPDANATDGSFPTEQIVENTPSVEEEIAQTGAEGVSEADDLQPTPPADGATNADAGSADTSVDTRTDEELAQTVDLSTGGGVNNDQTTQ